MGNPLFYLWAFYCSLTRLVARHTIIPPLRKLMFRSTGISIGKKTFINLDVYFFDEFRPGMVQIEDEVAIAPRVTFAAASHPNDSFIGKEYHLNKLAKIHVKKGAWIGTGVVILPGITIGKGAIIGANAVVTKDVDDFAIMAGVPAKKIGDVRDKKRRT